MTNADLIRQLLAEPRTEGDSDLAHLLRCIDVRLDHHRLKAAAYADAGNGAKAAMHLRATRRFAGLRQTAQKLDAETIRALSYRPAADDLLRSRGNPPAATAPAETPRRAGSSTGDESAPPAAPARPQPRDRRLP